MKAQYQFCSGAPQVYAECVPKVVPRTPCYMPDNTALSIAHSTKQNFRNARSPPTSANLVDLPGVVAPGYSYVGIETSDATKRRVCLGDLPFPPPRLHYGASPCSPRSTLIGSQDPGMLEWQVVLGQRSKPPATRIFLSSSPLPQLQPLLLSGLLLLLDRILCQFRELSKRINTAREVSYRSCAVRGCQRNFPPLSPFPTACWMAEAARVGMSFWCAHSPPSCGNRGAALWPLEKVLACLPDPLGAQLESPLHEVFTNDRYRQQEGMQSGARNAARAHAQLLSPTCRAAKPAHHFACSPADSAPRDPARNVGNFSPRTLIDSTSARLPPRRSGLDTRRVRIRWTMPLARGSSRGTPVSPALEFQRRSILGSRFMSCPGMMGTLRAPAGKPVSRRALPRPGFTPHSSPTATDLIYTAQGHDGNTARLARRGDEALGARVRVARIAPSLLDLQCAVGKVSVSVSSAISDFWFNVNTAHECSPEISDPRRYMKYSGVGWNIREWKRRINATKFSERTNEDICKTLRICNVEDCFSPGTKKAQSNPNSVPSLNLPGMCCYALLHGTVAVDPPPLFFPSPFWETRE
ncbi:hypothetical protein PR048_033544 [Dryococelus australis]|uniref:Uncharacterized protein n=1 Tax=Dryococelus australis TaxID=614101 RepID=A0ABQ9G0K2_9NEOP|nr:hypothetical protein PR048_033544 [Dryococelus australis]